VKSGFNRRANFSRIRAAKAVPTAGFGESGKINRRQVATVIGITEILLLAANRKPGSPVTNVTGVIAVG
jgi:hypothetical protein